MAAVAVTTSLTLSHNIFFPSASLGVCVIDTVVFYAKVETKSELMSVEAATSNWMVLKNNQILIKSQTMKLEVFYADIFTHWN